MDDQTNWPVVIVAVDDRSLDAMEKGKGFGWPWPRQFFGVIAQYLESCGAKAVAFDIVFEQKSVYQKSDGDDDNFADAMNGVGIPVVFGSLVKGDGNWDHFAPPVTRPSFGAVNVGNDVIYRKYDPQVYGKPSLAAQVVKASGTEAKLPADQPFLLHYFGPYKTKDGKRTFQYISAGSVIGAAMGSAAEAKAAGITPEVFKGKIVLVGVITVGTFDLKSSPLSPEYPGVEVQATAAVDLLTGRRVIPVSTPVQTATALAAALVAAVGITFPRKALVKILGPIVAVCGILGIGAMLFSGAEIRWLAPTGALLALAIATVLSFAWTYFAEDRQRRFMLKALSKVVSPAVAEQLAREPNRLALGTVRTTVTLLFTDLADFTAMSEKMDVQKLGELLNRYLGEMSDQVLANQGTLDKYIGDAIMCFWNAPLEQADHAVRACRAALAIAASEDSIRAELKQMGANKIFTRIGINTTDAAVGFVGSSHLFNYTALGDGVNLASRLEGANKMYGTRILMSQPTAELVKGQFILRKVDVVKVKGKKEPMAVFTLLADRNDPAAARFERLAGGYEKAFAAYQGRQWDMATQLLLELASDFSDDGAVQALLGRIEYLKVHPPADDWDGVYEAKEK